jgi:hypothetical protein
MYNFYMIPPGETLAGSNLMRKYCTRLERLAKENFIVYLTSVSMMKFFITFTQFTLQMSISNQQYTNEW